MSVIREQQLIKNSILETASRMMVAARTAPKGKGRDTLEIIVLTDLEIQELAQEMKRIGLETGNSFFDRDSENLNHSQAIVVIGTEIKTLGLNEVCQLCGFKNCSQKENHPNIPCVFNIGDLNIALGSAVTIAANEFVDNRIMFSIGKAAINLKFFNKDIKIAMGIPLAALSKNPFFDRK